VNSDEGEHYDNRERRRSWGHGHVSANPNIYGSMVSMETSALHLVGSVGVVYYELLKPNETITGDRLRLTTIDAFESRIEEKTTVIRAETQ